MSEDISAAFDLVIDKIERGHNPTEAELISANLCIECRGAGRWHEEDEYGDETEMKCKTCGGTGRHVNT